MFGRVWIAGQNESEPDGSVTCQKVDVFVRAAGDINAIFKAYKIIKLLHI